MAAAPRASYSGPDQHSSVSQRVLQPRLSPLATLAQVITSAAYLDQVIHEAWLQGQQQQI
jgi:hypothetical protein